MDIKSLEELRQPDQRTLRFAPLGLAMGGTMRPEDAAVFQQEVISHSELKIFNAGGYEGWCWSPRGAMPGA